MLQNGIINKITTANGGNGVNIYTDIAVNHVGKLYYHNGYLGSANYLTDEGGNIRAVTTSDEWGNVREGSNNDINIAGLDRTFGYTSYTYDKVLDLSFAQRRFYDGSDRRFISQDPVKDGVNWYRYCEGNPVRFVDPWGEELVYFKDYVQKMGGTVEYDNRTGRVTAKLNGMTYTLGRGSYKDAITYSSLNIENGRLTWEDYEIDTALAIGLNKTTSVTHIFDNEGKYKGLRFTMGWKDVTSSVVEKYRYDLKTFTSKGTLQGYKYDYFVDFYYIKSQKKIAEIVLKRLGLCTIH